MKNIYSLSQSSLVLFTMTIYETSTNLRRPSRNSDNNDNVTVSTSSGNYSTQFNFPWFNCERKRIFFCYIPDNFFLPSDSSPLGFDFVSLIHNTDDFSPERRGSEIFFRNDCKIIYVARRSRSKNGFVSIKQVYSAGNTWLDELKSGLKNTDELKINIYVKRVNDVVGIKFVNIFSSFLIQISNTQVQTVSGWFHGCYNVTARNVLVEANRSNEPSVLCQSTFN